MRLLVIGLVVLAGLKVWTQDRTYRAVMGEALTEAYRSHAAEVCRKMSGKGAGLQGATSETAWSLAPGARAQLGNPDVDVAMWDTNNPAWEKRYRHPSLVLSSVGERGRHCTYDVADGSVTFAP
jgi:hypothetical protein